MSRLSGHVRASQNDHPGVIHQPEVIGDELVARHHPLDHRMSPAHDVEIEIVAHRRTDVSLARGNIGQRAQHIELGDRTRDVLQPIDV
jgi:hypothetical protein